MGTPASTLQANYDAWHAVDPSRPVMVNFDGSRIVGWQGGLTQASYTPYIKASDWVAQDVYPVTGFNNPSALGIVGQAVSTLKNWSVITDPVTGVPAAPKPTFAFIETSNQRLFSNTFPEWAERGPRPAEMRAEIWDAVIHGARGIFYFPQSFGAFQYDATPIDVAAEMTKQDSIIAGVAPVLNSSDTPDVTTVTFSNGSLECLTKSYGGLTYLIVLNLSNGTVTSTILADFAQSGVSLQVLNEGRTLSAGDVANTFQDTFAPYGVHIYVETWNNSPAALVPEPTGAISLLAGSLLLVRRRRRR
jgi:hypothetical protein